MSFRASQNTSGGEFANSIALGGSNSVPIDLAGSNSLASEMNDDPMKIVNLYKTFLTKMENKLLGYMDKFYDSSGGVEYQLAEHSELSIDLVTILNNNPGVDNFERNMALYSKAINGIYASSIYYEKCETTIKDKDREIEYYTSDRNLIMSAESVLEEVATIRPEIEKYVQLYGVPNNLVFDSIKLGNILLAL